ncbi:MAG: hypothetical protein ACT4QF_05025 [Sporichthyaceae bacterium]
MTDAPIVWTDDLYDRDYASDGLSRFGGYVRQRAHLFVDDWEPLSPAAFAATVWTIATSPVMSPPYVHLRPDVSAVTCRHAEEPGLLLAEVEIRLRWPAGLNDFPDLCGWSSWDRWIDRPTNDVHLIAPSEHKRALLTTATLRVPIPETKLPTSCRFAEADVAIAKRAVAAVCSAVDVHVRPVLAYLATATIIGADR